MKFIKLNERHINTEQIVSISEDEKYYHIRMSNADAYRVEKNNEIIKRIINDKEAIGYAELQLPSERTTKRTNRSIQRPTK